MPTVEQFAPGDLSRDFEWDENKNQRNIVERGIDFKDAIDVYNRPTLQRKDTRKPYPEERVIVYGETNGVLLVLVHTIRDDRCRIISARQANHNERRQYREAVAARPPPWED